MVNIKFYLFLSKKVRRMAYRQCTYTAQGKLECRRDKQSQASTIIETYVESAARGKNVDNKGINVSFTERPTSKTIWDKTSANIICTPLCAKFEQVWTQGFRSTGGSVCYCQDVPPPIAAPVVEDRQSQINKTEPQPQPQRQPRVFTNSEIMDTNYLQ